MAGEPLVFGVGTGRCGQAVVAERADEGDRSALAHAGHGLVEALAAGTHAEAQRAPGFAGFGELVGQPHVVLHITADDDDGRSGIAGMGRGSHRARCLKGIGRW